MLVTDVHNHAMPKAVLELIVNDPAYEVWITDGIWTSRNQTAFPVVDAWHDPAAKLAEMDSREIDRAVLSVAPKPLFFYDLPLDKQRLVTETANAGLAEFCLTQPDRLRWMAHIPLAFPDEAAKVLRNAVDMGASGVEIGTSAAGRRLDNPAFEIVWETIESLKCPVFLHPAYESKGPEAQGYCLDGVLGLPYEITNALQRLICGRVLDRHPDLKILAALGGGYFPYIAGRLRHYTTFVPELQESPPDPWSYVGQLKFDTHVHDTVTLRYLIERAGASNVLVGTDCSFLSSTPRPLEELRVAAGDDMELVRQVAETNSALFWRP